MNLDRFYLENILAQIPEYVFWKDTNSVYVGCNYNFSILAGLNSIEEIIGKTDQELPWSEYAKDIYLKEDKQIIQTRKPIVHEAVPFVGIDGTKKIIMVSKSPLFDKKNKIIGILGVFHDITELKNTQQVLSEQIKETKRAYHSKTEFLSITTHEIRNPVGNIVVFSEFLKKEIEELQTLIHEDLLQHDKNKEKKFDKYEKVFDKIKENIYVVEGESYKALDYLENLGELHKLEKHNIEPKFIFIKIQDLISGVIRNTEKYNTKGIEVLTSIDSSIPEDIEIDYQNIYQALQVIVSNAIRFSYDKGVVKFQIKQENEKLKIIVEDFGKGMSLSQIKDLLNEKLEQNGSLYRKPSLRLTQAKLKIEASGGKLFIEKKDTGTKVYITVPYKNSSQKNELEVEHDLVKKNKKKRKILIVDDDLLFQKAEKVILENFGHAVSVASTGKEALNMISKNKYDIVFIDITLPDISGVEIIKEIRKENTSLIIIVVTSHAHQTDIEFFEEMGATLVLTKPISEENLKECLDFDFNDED